jgi:hypothetical protein
VLEDPVADVIIGNIPGLLKSVDVPSASAGVVVGAVTTRAQAKRDAVPHKALVEVSKNYSVLLWKLFEL